MPPHSINEHDDNEDPAAVFPDPPREHLINTAVKFLQNPRVRPTSLSHKRKFLKQKGLTDEEIEMAFQKAGAFVDEQNNNMPGPVVVARPYYEKPSLWIKAKDVANLVALFSIGSYSLYSLWKRYIAPRLFGTRSRNEQNYESLLAAIVKLNQNVIELKELIRELHGPPGSSIQKSRQAYEIQEIKNELTSIKSLLLSRSQFPTSPAGIPSWQMIGVGDSSNAGDDRSQSHDNDNDNIVGGGSVDPAEGGATGGGGGSASGSRRRKNKSQKPQRKGQGQQAQGQGGDSTIESPGELLSLSEAGSTASASGSGVPPTMRKHPSVDSNNGFHSGSSCEVVFVGGKNDSEPDHSDD